MVIFLGFDINDNVEFVLGEMNIVMFFILELFIWIFIVIVINVFFKSILICDFILYDLKVFYIFKGKDI